MDSSFKSKKVIILTGDFAEDYEMMFTYQALLLVGHTVAAICPGKKAGETIKTAVHAGVPGAQTFGEDEGHNFKLTHTFDDIKPEEWDAISIVGGRCPEYLRTDEKVLNLVRHFLDKNKPTSAICHGIQILLSAGIKDRTVCC